MLWGFVVWDSRISHLNAKTWVRVPALKDSSPKDTVSSSFFSFLLLFPEQSQQMKLLGFIFSYHLMPRPGFQLTSEEFHRDQGPFEGRSTNWATAPRLCSQSSIKRCSLMNDPRLRWGSIKLCSINTTVFLCSNKRNPWTFICNRARSGKWSLMWENNEILGGSRVKLEPPS